MSSFWRLQRGVVSLSATSVFRLFFARSNLQLLNFARQDLCHDVYVMQSFLKIDRFQKLQLIAKHRWHETPQRSSEKLHTPFLGRVIQRAF